MRYIFLIILLTACKCPKKAVGTGGQEIGGSNTLTFILSDAYGGGAEEGLQVFRSQGELQKFFAGVNKTRKPGLPLPQIDFSKNMVLVYSAGESRAANIPKLIALEAKADSILIGTKKEEGQADSASAAVTMPFVIYSMPRTDKNVVLERRNLPPK